VEQMTKTMVDLMTEIINNSNKYKNKLWKIMLNERWLISKTRPQVHFGYLVPNAHRNQRPRCT
jgi:hypothetical protein